MKASDTVMTENQLVVLPSYNRDNVLFAQAEISFKAGIKEVVEFTRGKIYGRIVDKKTHAHKLRIEIPLELWQSKLKSWGISE